MSPSTLPVTLPIILPWNRLVAVTIVPVTVLGVMLPIRVSLIVPPVAINVSMFAVPRTSNCCCTVISSRSNCVNDKSPVTVKLLKNDVPDDVISPVNFCVPAFTRIVVESSAKTLPVISPLTLPVTSPLTLPVTSPITLPLY